MQKTNYVSEDYIAIYELVAPTYWAKSNTLSLDAVKTQLLDLQGITLDGKRSIINPLQFGILAHVKEIEIFNWEGKVDLLSRVFSAASPTILRLGQCGA